MTLFEAYQEGLKKLKNPALEEINLRILLCEINGLKTMSDFYIHKNENIIDLQRFSKDLQRFLNGEPVQYILQKATFLGLDFYVDNSVLIPRNETEELVVFTAKKIDQIFGDKKVVVADVCTGSGCIGCSLFKRANILKILFSDISEKAIEIAKKNATNLRVKGEFFVADSLDYLDEKIDVIVANPPYILNRDDVDKFVLEYEPHLALFTDNELSIYQKIIKKAVALQIPLIVFEIGYDLENKLREISQKIAPNYELSFENDINNVLRICSLEKKH